METREELWLEASTATHTLYNKVKNNEKLTTNDYLHLLIVDDLVIEYGDLLEENKELEKKIRELENELTRKND
jgi:uncharacterized coiled-coil DUF342 family protein